ncbi:hypothetical protein BN946_scf185033.g22 [Trametes cinnabarina]|uniref:F-box domain-containing protein n=1 Tax=Pycnoporus cinnabarinus TaxID=5643 RepID=A0A060SR56_PYCCI|nr:hypothetical protein BN946_scf185033.g22 [Trametes cinnabarina]
MNALPLELHSQIFEFACTDDGKTARSLALVSRYVHDVSVPYRYQSLSISGLKQMKKLVTRLNVTPHHLRRIRHLFLSDWTHDRTKERVVATSDEARDTYELESTIALRIITLAAPTVETLAVVVASPFSGPSLLGSLFSTPMPQLTDLAVHGFYPFPHAPRSMPRLEHLHLSGNRSPHGLLHFGMLKAACPALIHLRLSGLFASASFAEELRSAILSAHDDTAAQSDPFRASLPQQLRTIVVEAREMHVPGARKHGIPRGLRLMHEKMLVSLRELERRADPLLARRFCHREQK